jgi:hypothetical protein
LPLRAPLLPTLLSPPIACSSSVVDEVVIVQVQSLCAIANAVFASRYSVLPSSNLSLVLCKNFVVMIDFAEPPKSPFFFFFFFFFSCFLNTANTKEKKTATLNKNQLQQL